MFLFFIFLLFCTSPLVVCDDTQALRNAVKCLCEENTVGKFASCCASHSNGVSITLSSTQFFFTSVSIHNENVIKLFAFLHSLLFPPFLLNFIGINNKGLTFLPGGCFSSLSSLSLFHPPFSLHFFFGSPSLFT